MSTRNPMNLKTRIDPEPQPDVECGLHDWAAHCAGACLPVEALATGMCYAASQDCGIDPYSVNATDCAIIAAMLSASPLAPGKISARKVGEALARLPKPAPRAVSDATFTANLLTDTFKVGPWHRDPLTPCPECGHNGDHGCARNCPSRDNGGKPNV